MVILVFQRVGKFLIPMNKLNTVLETERTYPYKVRSRYKFVPSVGPHRL